MSHVGLYEGSLWFCGSQVAPAGLAARVRLGLSQAFLIQVRDAPGHAAIRTGHSRQALALLQLLPLCPIMDAPSQSGHRAGFGLMRVHASRFERGLLGAGGLQASCRGRARQEPLGGRAVPGAVHRAALRLEPGRLVCDAHERRVPGPVLRRATGELVPSLVSHTRVSPWHLEALGEAVARSQTAG